jgi:hypothetical protein
MTITHSTFASLAFPVTRVRYSNGKWHAQIFRDSDCTYRARTSYNHAVGGGARGARAAAFDKALADSNGLSADGDYVAIPGDMDASTYVFTFVPVHFFG